MTATDGEPVFLTGPDADVLPAIPDRRLERFVWHHGRAGVAADVLDNHRCYGPARVFGI
ncbi:MAG: hypothetical protein ACLQIK_07135 [Mycobacterium sp.]|uniref:hypothetical protein n=1 Tax=Mycobacterium sp. TaxID=1785 RepID=UPI003F9B93AA